MIVREQSAAVLLCLLAGGLAGGCAPKACPTTMIGLDELVGQPEEGRSDLQVAGRQPRLGPFRIHLRRKRPAGVPAHPSPAAGAFT